MNIARRIVDTAMLTPKDVVMEPGAGYGTLTRLIAERAGRVFAVEKDHRLVSILHQTFSGLDNIRVVEGDVLEAEMPEPFNKIVGTPPYNISSKIVILMERAEFELASIIFQKEFGQRLLAAPGSRDYGRLSLSAQRRLEIESVMTVSRYAFSPRPRVDSILLRITRKTPADGLDEGLFDSLLRGLFTQRKRLSRGSLRHWLRLMLGRKDADRVMNRLVLPDLRVYQLTVAQLESLTGELGEALSSQGLSIENSTGKRRQRD